MKFNRINRVIYCRPRRGSKEAFKINIMQGSGLDSTGSECALVNMVMKFGVPQKAWDSLTAAQFLASQAGLCFMELVTNIAS